MSLGSRRWLVTATLCFAAMACDSGLFVEPAEDAPAIRISYSLSEAARIIAGGGAAAFEAADGVRIRVLREEAAVLDTLVSFTPAEETRIGLQLPSSAAGPAVVEVGILNGEDLLFHGTASADLARGATTPIEISLGPVPHHVEIDRAVQRIELGDTLFLTGSPAFATGHAIAGELSWSANPDGLVELDRTSGRLIAKQEGATRITGTFGGLSDTMTITIRSEVASVSLSVAQEIEVGETTQAEVEVFDKRGNLLDRTVEWSSSNTGVATVDAAGLVRGLSAGETRLSVSAEGKSDSAPLRVVEPCVPAPPPLEENGFRVSGVVARAAGLLVDVVLNPILVDGRPVRGLTAENFQVYEDECVRPFTVTTSEGAVGVDLVFIQDLSGSMGGAITGVRNSVISFAEQLVERGLDIRIGSVGYSGPSTIPSTPAGSPDEFLGPVQDLTTPEVFRKHVEAEWVATGGGDAPENGLEAIEYAHRMLSWRPGATRVMILITDISLHWSGSFCGCSDQTIESIAELIGESTVVHSVAPAIEEIRTADGGVDPWVLADATGGVRLVLNPNGTVDLNALDIESVLAETIRLTFESASEASVPHDLRVRVTLPGGVQSEFVADGVRYDPLAPELKTARIPRR